MIKVFLSNRNGADAVGQFNEKTKELTVLKGSHVSDTISTSPKFRGTETIKKKRNEVTKNGIVQVDVTFKSCSTAANFVTGNSSNGYRTWKNEEGKVLKLLVEGDE